MTTAAHGRDNQRHDAVTRRAATWLAVTAATATGVSMSTYVFAAARTVNEYESIPSVLAYLTAIAALATVGVWARTPKARRRSLWVAALLLVVPAAYLLPVWWLSAPLVVACAAAGASALLVGHRQRCRKVRRVAGRL